jgi:hypothetical protein
MVVILTILGILFGLFVAAVEKLREAAGRTQCQNNLKQIVLGLHNYAGTYQLHLPPLYSAPKLDGVACPQSLFFTVLPYIESDHVYSDGMRRAAVPGLTWTGIYDGSPIYSSVFYKTYICPADSTNSVTQRTAIGWIGGSYGANYQIFGTEDWKPKYTIDNIPDGNSFTVFIAERFAQYPGEAGKFIDPEGKVQQANTLWAWPANYPPNPPTSYTSPVPQNAALFAFHNARTAQGYGEVVFERPQMSITPPQADYRLVQSGHYAVVQVGMGDGSVHSVTQAVSQPTWQAALTPADGKPLGNDW